MAWESRSCHFHPVNHMTILYSGLGGEGDGSGDTDGDGGDGGSDVEGDGGSDNDSSLGNSSSVGSFSAARNRFQNGSHPR